MSTSNNNDDSCSSLQLCLTAVGLPRHVVTLSTNATLEDLHRVAQNAFSVENLQLQHGFPPQLMECNNHTTLETAKVHNMDRIQVIFMNKESKKKSSNTTTTKTTTTTTRPPKRAAAKAATESFQDVIRAQDEMMTQQSTSSSSFAKRKRNNATSRNTSSTSSTSRSPNNNLARLPGGRRLADGAAVRSSSSTSSRPPKTARFKNPDDVSEALLSAVSSHGGGGKVGQVLRGAMRNAVARAHDASRAVSKVSAVQSKQYTITEQDGRRLQVDYSKGLEGRGVFSEYVDLIPRTTLEAVITSIYQSEERDMLKGTTMAQLSPRVFWSLIHLYPECQSVEDALQYLCPNLDWSFSKQRKRQLSAKAKENLLQQEKDTVDAEKAQEAVHDVEQAMDQLSAYDASQRRERAARAALARHEPHEWQLLTPTEDDDDELRECVTSGGAFSPPQNDLDRILSVLGSLDIHNWRQLANANESEISNALGNIPKEQVNAWMDYAQEQSVDEIMVEVCDGNVDAVQVLRDEARTGTPKDLANWRHVPDMLYSSAPSLAQQSVSVSDLQTWCHRAQQVLDEWEWVTWYATPVE